MRVQKKEVKKPMEKHIGSDGKPCAERPSRKRLLNQGLSMVLCRSWGDTLLASLVLHQQANRDVSKELCRCRIHE